jgi:hypothetical protein
MPQRRSGRQVRGVWSGSRVSLAKISVAPLPVDSAWHTAQESPRVGADSVARSLARGRWPWTSRADSREYRAAAAARCRKAQNDAAASSQTRPPVLGGPCRTLDAMAHRLDTRPAWHRRAVASRMVSAAVDSPITIRTRRSAASARFEDARSGPRDGVGESVVGSAAHPR